MPKNPFTDAWQFLTAATEDYMALGGWRFLILALFYALVIASVIIAVVPENSIRRDSRGEAESGHHQR